MDSELRGLLANVASDTQSESHTHVTYYGPHCRWVIRDREREKFWEEYCNLVQRKLKSSDSVESDPLALICLAEKPIEHMPIIGKFKFKFETQDDGDWNPYGTTFLQHLVFTYQKAISELFDCRIDTQDDSFLELVVVVLESSVHWFEEQKDKKYMVTEVQLQFPYAKVDASQQARVLRPRVIQLLKEGEVLSKMDKQPIGDWDEILQLNTADTPVPMYGSSEEPNKPKLEITHIWEEIKTLENNSVSDMDLDKIFVPQNHEDVTNGIVSVDMFGPESEIDYELYLPMFLSVHYFPEPLFLLESESSKMSQQETKPRPFGRNRSNANNDDDNDTMPLCKQMLEMIKTSRFQKETLWLDVGKALYNADEGGENGMIEWVRQTEKAVGSNVPDFMKTEGSIQDTCRHLYDTFSKAAITVKTLAWYAREDSPYDYGQWHKDWCIRSMEDAISAHNTDVAVALHRVYWLDYVFCPIGKGKWFKFRNNRWSEMNHGIELRRAISRDFVKKFETVRHTVSQSILTSDDEDFRTSAENTMKKISSLIGKLKDVGYKNKLMTEACEHFVQDNFIDLMDLDSDLTGVINGVLEITGGVVQYRKAKPEDYISMSTGVPFHEHFSWNHDLVKRTLKWLSQVFTNRDLLHHFLKFSASCLKGRNADKIFPIWTGGGDNSKSMIVKLFEATLHAYCIKFPVAMLTDRNTSAAGAAPQLARAKHTRIAFLDEPEDDIPMNKGTIKRYTGGDAFYARALHDNGGDIEATFKMVLMCNKPPIIPNADKAIKNRTRLFPFTSTWVDDAPKPEEEQMKQRKFKKDPNFEKQIPILAPAFLWIMVNYYSQYATEGLKDPEIITQWTESYWRDNDIYAQFAADSITEVWTPDGERDPHTKVSLSEVYAEFKIWFRDAFPGNKVPERQQFRSELVTRWGPLHGTSWHGIKLMNSGASNDVTASLGGRSNLGSQLIPSKTLDTSSIYNAPTKPILPTKNIDTSSIYGAPTSDVVKDPLKDLQKDFSKELHKDLLSEDDGVIMI